VQSQPLSHLTYPSSRSERPIVPPSRAGHRRRFSEAGKRQILEEAARPDASVGGVARRIELDNNAVERVIRPITLGSKSHLLAGFEGGAARGARRDSLLPAAKLNDVEPFAHLMTARRSDGQPDQPASSLPSEALNLNGL